MSNPTSDNLDTLYRQHSAQMLAYLYCLTQDLDTAQELWHETFIEAMHLWQTRRPNSVSAWFKRIAKNKFIDRYRHQKMSAEKSTLIKALLTEESQDDTMEATDFGDEQLKLIFTCCHPALDFDKQVALTLNIISGLSTDQVSKALLLQTSTLEQRLTRAKRKIKQAAIPFVIPQKNHLAERLNAVLKTLYLMYNTGTQHPEDPYQLSQHAIFLVQRLDKLLPYQAEIEGMLALMLFHDARKAARFDTSGKFVRLSEQNRYLWNKVAIEEADRILQVAMSRNSLGVYQLQAAVQGIHSLAEDYASTDWLQIEALYRVHLTLDNSPVVRLNAIYAISMSRSVEAALNELKGLESTDKIANYSPYYALLADFHIRLKQWSEAISQLNQARLHTSLPHEQDHFLQQIQYCEKQLS